MRMPKYPAGVPSPYSTHVHPYPTRFHGPIYTRPVFGFPYSAGVQSVFKPDDFSEFYEGKNAMSGDNGSLGELQYNTGRGIFRPGGRGGGIFDGNIAGLGSTGALGATCAQVAHDTAVSFCNANAGSLAVLGFSSQDDCVTGMAKGYEENCGSTAPAAPSAGSSYPWGVYSADTLALQKTTNVALKKYGYCPIGEDGKLGKGTCGARLALKSDIPGMTNPSTCQGFTAPRRAPCGSSGGGSSPAPSSLTPAQQAALVQQYGSGSDWKKYAVFGVGAVAVLGLAYYFEKRRSKK